MAKTAKSEATPVLQYKSPDSSNVYTVIAKREQAEIGLSVDAANGRLILRFCVFSEAQPEFKNMDFRFGSKMFVQYPKTDPTVTRPGCSLNKVEVPVVQSHRAQRQDLIEALNADDGWDKLGQWIFQTLESEGFKLVCENQGQLVQLLPQLLTGFGIDKMPVKIEYPAPIAKPVAKPKVKPAAHHDDEDGDFKDDTPY